MSLAACATPFLTTDQKGSDAWPWVTTARWMLPRPLEVEVLVDVDPDVQASRIAARPGTAATAAPATADFLKRSRRVRSAAISHLPFGFESDYALEEHSAAASVPDWARPGLGLSRQHDILLQHVPAAIARCLEVPHQCGDVDDARAERPEETLPDGLGIVKVATLDSSQQQIVDVLQVYVLDARTGGLRELDRVHAADEQVTGVKAETDVGELEQAAHILRALDDGSCMWVEGQLQAMGTCDLLGSCEARCQGRPARLVQRLTVVVPAAGGGGDHEHVATGPGDCGGNLAQLALRPVQPLRPVQDCRYETSRQLEAFGVEQAGDLLGICWEIAGRP